MKVDFECRIPRARYDAPGGRPSLYGHGLFGGYGEVNAGNVEAMANEHNFIFCATDWAGMADRATCRTSRRSSPTSRTSRRWPTASSRAFVNFMLPRPADDPPAGPRRQRRVPDAAASALIDTARLYYDGNSQGGIIGGALTALAPDFNRAVLGVPGMNYSTLLTRSTDFGTGTPTVAATQRPDRRLEYAYPLYTPTRTQLERPLIFALMQMLWDRARARRLRAAHDRRPVPEHAARTRCCCTPAFGDHQVANVAAEVEARTIGAYRAAARARTPGAQATSRRLGASRRSRQYPFDGSALVVLGHRRPRAAREQHRPAATDADPHGHPRSTRGRAAQKAAFLAPDGKVVDTCGGAPCHTDGYTAP